MPTTLYIAPQQIEQAQKQVGNELCRTLERITSRLVYDRQSHGRDYVELREVKSLLSHLKYADPTDPVRMDEMAWALSRLRDACENTAPQAEPLLRRAASILDIDLAKQHPIPTDLGRKIHNAVVFMQPAPLAATA